MSEVKRFDHVNHAHVDDCEHIDNPEGAWVKASDYDALAAEAQALREEVARAEQHRNDQADLIVSLRTEVAALRMARDDLKLERDLARQNFCDEQAANYQLQAHLKACLGELSELRARVVVLPSVDNVMNIVMRYQWNEKTNVTGTTNWAANLGMRVVEVVKRLNGKTVSEGLLRRISDLFPADMGDDGSGRAGWFPHVRETVAELRALLNQDKENGDHAA
ncbi:hypothetical protein IPC618_08045 [Pseudomonas aeruginosa]|uniref:hypothetical protein n=1 Tax=Pseudomonas aeruginosa TaxID=287 RepID=UPI00035D0781|nr:hypothetical protein [Pseudomonas aeruginosa]AMX89750.1 hypothetical protein A4W92_22965 [Pseudomonas aeruginosa]ANT74938.1 hypothetical protein ACG06_06360 [Pseudomonas aeruginosa]ASP07896.1 hypothetical protein CGU46_24460 [Pseudomonas aeruginosa]ASP15651.1 hypothetical protein CGU45_31480 [Pseudomonas aeruginosa]EIU3463796.1 hypothetical protein [Pseudomonas aeruginosa]